VWQTYKIKQNKFQKQTEQLPAAVVTFTLSLVKLYTRALINCYKKCNLPAAEVCPFTSERITDSRAQKGCHKVNKWQTRRGGLPKGTEFTGAKNVTGIKKK